MSEFVDRLNHIKSLCEDAKDSLADEHEGEFRFFVREIQRHANILMGKVEDM